MIDVMIDLETLSTQPDAAIVSIGACTFYTDGELTPDGCRVTFYKVLRVERDIKKGGRMSFDTMAWWMDQSVGARSVFERPNDMLSDPEYALTSFRTWLNRLGDEVLVWGNGANFDNVVLREAYIRHGVTPPWSFRQDRCFRTLKSLNPHVLARPNTAPHNALADAIAQAEHAEDIFAATKVSAP